MEGKLDVTATGKKEPVQKKGTYIKTIEKTMDIINMFKDKPKIGTMEISRELFMNKSVVSKILLTLESFGFVRKSHDSKYEIGPKAFEIGMLYVTNNRLVQRAYPFLETLMQETSMTIQLCSSDGHEIIIVASVESPEYVKIDSGLGEVVPIPPSAAGKIILASMKDDEIESYIKKVGLTAYTPKTITDYDNYMKEIHAVREKGYSVANEEWKLGVVAIGALIENALAKPSYALVAAAPAGLIPEIGPIAELVKATARKLSTPY